MVNWFTTVVLLVPLGKMGARLSQEIQKMVVAETGSQAFL